MVVQKIMHGKGGLNAETWFERADDPRNTRSAPDPLGIKKVYGRRELRKNFFTMRVIDDWNRIPPELKKVSTSEEFKRKYKLLRATR